MVTSLKGLRHDYFEGILQLRDVDEDFVDSVVTEIEGSGKCEISKIEPVPGGMDIYVSDNHYVQALGKSLKSRHGGEVTVTKKLYGRYKQTGHIVYRVTVLFRKFPLSLGDVITTDEGDVKVIAIGKNVTVQNVVSKKKERVSFEQLLRYVR